MFFHNLKRLFITVDIIEQQNIEISKEQSHYLTNVMRLKIDDKIKIFNGKQGEWLADIKEIKKNKVTIKPVQKLKEQEKLPDIWLLFAPLKKNETDFVIQKATELGVTKITPVITKRTIASRVNIERLTQNAIEASEQCERLCIPEITKEISLDKIINNFSDDYKLYFLDERGQDTDIKQAFSSKYHPAFLIGPEGGFDNEEKDFLLKQSFVTSITLGKRILRAETAAITSIVCWQTIVNNWT